MTFAKQASIATGILSTLATSVMAQEVATEGLGKIGSLIQSIVGGIFTGLSNAIWMKAILITIIFTILYIVFNSDSIKLFQGKRSSNIVLSLAIALAAIAPIPNLFIIELFGALGFVGLLLYVAPVIGVMFLTRKITEKDTAKPDASRRAEYVVSLIIWVVMFFVYIYGIGPSAASSLKGASVTRDILGLVGLIYIIYYAVRAMMGDSSPVVSTPDAITATKENVAKIKHAYSALAPTTLAQYKKYATRAKDAATALQGQMVSITHTADMLMHQANLKRALGTLVGAMSVMISNKPLLAYLDTINKRHKEQLIQFEATLARDKYTDHARDWKRLSATDQTELLDDLNAMAARGTLFNLLESIETDLN